MIYDPRGYSRSEKVITESMDKKIDTFAKLYLFSNENLEGYYNSFNYRNKNALVPGSSADQVINLINHDCSSINFF